MSKLKVTTIADVADSESTDVTNVINGSAKAWVNFDGTFGSSPYTVANGGIRAAFNVSSVVDNGTGNYTVNFTNAFADTNYVSFAETHRDPVAATTGDCLGIVDMNVSTASSARLLVTNSDAANNSSFGDRAYIRAVFFR